MALSEYLNDTSVLISDSTYSFTSKTQLTRWVNEGRREIAKRNGCIRRLITGQSAYGASAQPGLAIPGAMQPSGIPDAIANGGGVASGNGISAAAATLNMQTIPGCERYPYQGFFNPVLQAQHAGCASVQDIVTLAVNWGGASRPVLNWMPWDDFQAYCRAYAVLNTDFPSVWSVLNDGANGEVWLFPIPSTAGDIEADCFVLPSDIWSNNDYDAIPDGFKDLVKFAAAEMAFMANGRYAQAEVMYGKYLERGGTAVVSRDRGKTSSYYG